MLVFVEFSFVGFCAVVNGRVLTTFAVHLFLEILMVFRG